jgi:hypothetical protein
MSNNIDNLAKIPLDKLDVYSMLENLCVTSQEAILEQEIFSKLRKWVNNTYTNLSNEIPSTDNVIVCLGCLPTL